MKSVSIKSLSHVRRNVGMKNYELAMFIELGVEFSDGPHDMISIYVTDRARKSTRNLTIDSDPTDSRGAQDILKHMPGISATEEIVLEQIITAWLVAGRFALAREKQNRDVVNSFRERVHELRSEIQNVRRERRS